MTLKSNKDRQFFMKHDVKLEKKRLQRCTKTENKVARRNIPWMEKPRWNTPSGKRRIKMSKFVNLKCSKTAVFFVICYLNDNKE